MRSNGCESFMLRPMRAAAVTISLVALLCALPASAAQVEPRALVLQRSDVPADFRLDPTKSGAVPNAEVPDPYDPAFVARTGRITGYFVQYVQPGAGVGLQSRADLFRKPGGARMMLARVHEGWLKLAYGDSWGRVRIGAEGWFFGGDVDTAVYWRHGRVFALVLGINMTKARTLELARKQQRRIAAALGS
jgi:hypothetical protein